MAPTNSNGNGRVRELVFWILSLAIPVLIAAMAATYAATATNSERIKGCEVQSAAQASTLQEIKEDVRETNRKLDRLLERK